jgi:hypothetical protein
MSRIDDADTRSLTYRPSLSSQNLLDCKLGKKRLRVRFFACDTLFPDCGRLPDTWQTRDMAQSLNSNKINMLYFKPIEITLFGWLKKTAIWQRKGEKYTRLRLI